MEKFESYRDCIDKVRKVNPKLKYHDAQKLASTLWDEQKREVKPETKTITKAKDISITLSPALKGVEGKINSNAATINEIHNILRQNNILFDEVIKYGKDGANTKVYVKLSGGGRLPATGFFTVY